MSDFPALPAASSFGSNERGEKSSLSGGGAHLPTEAAEKSSDCEDQDSVPDSCGGNRTCCDAVAAESGANSSPSSAAPPLRVLTRWSQSATSAGEQRDPQLSGRAQPAAVHLAGRTESPASRPKDAREAQ